jgi:hypothetical protein
MFDPSIVQDTLNRVVSPNNAIYKCRIARFDSRIANIFMRELKGSAGFIPESNNPDWHFPVVFYPIGTPSHNQPCHVVFYREDRKDGNGRRDIVRIYGLPERETAPPYRVTAAFVSNALKTRVLLGEKNNCRFAVSGMAENQDSGTSRQFPEGGLYAGRKDYAFVAIAMSDAPVKAIYQETKNNSQEEIEF